jgi:hypothetical protein
MTAEPRLAATLNEAGWRIRESIISFSAAMPGEHEENQLLSG